MIYNDNESISDLYANIAKGQQIVNEAKTPPAFTKKGKPDYLDVDEDGDKEEPMKKALKDKKEIKEHSRFKTLFLQSMNEGADKKGMKGMKDKPGMKKGKSVKAAYKK